jgi:transmembrane sensor
MMSHLHQPDKAQREAIEAEAARLVILLESCDDKNVRQAAFQWVEANPFHAVAFAAADDAWRKSDHLRLRSANGNPPREEPDQSGSPERFAAKSSDWTFPLTRRQAGGGLIALAASLAAAVGMGIQFNLFSDRRKTGLGQRETARLTDGSSIALNGDTTVDLLIDQRRRKVRLVRGEVMFDVAKDADRPFIVDLGQAQVRVLGTKFNIRLREGVTELAVSEGVVAVSSTGTHPVMVSAGFSALIRPGIATSLINDPGIVQQRIAWTEGFLEFDQQPLEEVVEEFNRYRTNPIVIGDPRIAGTVITGRFGIDESDAFAEALQSSFDIVVSKTDNGALILMQGQPTHFD